MLFFIFFFSIKAAVDLPLLNFDTYGIPDIYFDSWSYQYKNCSKTVNDTQCMCKNYINYNDKSCVENITNPNDIILNSYIIVNETLYNQAKNSFKIPTEINYFDVISKLGGDMQHIRSEPNDLIKTMIYNNSILCNFDDTNQTACNFLVNMCAVSMYNPNFEACKSLNQIFENRNRNLNGYYDWPINQPFFDYTDNLNNVMKEHFVQSHFSIGDIVTFQLGQYSQNGKFKGFKELKADLQKCKIKKNRNQLWRQFGWNYFSDCKFNFSFAYDSTDFFDIFFQEKYNGNDNILNRSFPVIRPIPILLKNYRDLNNVDVNRRKDESQYKLFRRFFLLDNYTSSITQVLSDITIVLTARTTDKTGIQTPYLILEYTQVNSNSNFLPKFSFNVQYTMDMRSFWDAVLYVFIVLVILFLAYWIIHSFLYYRQYAYGGTDMHIVINIITDFFLLTGALFFIVCLVFGLFLLWFYKWTNKNIVFLPEEKELFIFFPVMWVSFCLLAIGIILKIYLQTDLDFFLIDWENPHRESFTISAWRRLLIGNEWCKITTIRAYSLSFTLICVLFITKGFNTIVIASPIPSSKLIDIGCTYKILRFAYISFLWLLLILLQYILINFVYWKIAGNPFINFLEICRTAKISCFLLSTKNHGYYLHGKKNDLHADVDIESLNEGMSIDMNDDVEVIEEAARGKVFEIYLTSDFYHLILEKYYSMKIGIDRSKRAPAPYETYDSMNTFLRQFIEQKDAVNRYYVKEWQYIQMIDLGPEVSDDSIFTNAPEHQFKYSMMYGIQGILMVFYLVLFTSIDITTYSPEIGAFAVFMVDWIIFYVFKFRSRNCLSARGILDSRFLIM